MMQMQGKMFRPSNSYEENHPTHTPKLMKLILFLSGMTIFTVALIASKITRADESLMQQIQKSNLYLEPNVGRNARDLTGQNISSNQLSSKTEILPIKNTTRSKVKWCHWRPHMQRPMDILRNHFGYTEEVDPIAGHSWDMIFGGYPNCGDKHGPFDWRMETGLNKYLNEQGWDTLQPHQVWFPCMGCKESYCNKRGLCLLMKKIDPSYCFSLPDDRDYLIDSMKKAEEGTEGTGARQLWVLKEDHPDQHLHVGAGVRFIESTTELPSEQDQSSGAFLVQPLVSHKLGVGEYHSRRHELRMYVAVTSTSPLRAYSYKVVGKFANAEIDHANPLAPCSVDMHGTKTQMKLGCHINETFSAYRSFDQFSVNIGITDDDKQLFLDRTNQLIGKILVHAQPAIQNQTINQAITKSGAACFSFLRVDFAMTDAIEPYIYEINEFPFANEKGFFGSVQEGAYQDLFEMMGLGRPPMIASERGRYEMSNLGRWTPVVTDDVIQY